MSGWRDLSGSLADGAILFPLLAALTLKTGASAPLCLACAGLAYLAAGLTFRVPMAVQPLKSIAIAAVALGASLSEVRMAAVALALCCLALCLCDVDRLAARIPARLIHGLQLGLGVILIAQGLRFLGDGPSWQFALLLPLLGLLAHGSLLRRRGRTGIPWLGVVASLGLIWAVIHGLFTGARASGVVPHPVPPMLRLTMVATLFFPQLALTLANSVVGTRDVASRYYGERARRVTLRRLLASVGLGNLLSALAGGLPYCHGSGGLTAHYRGGARHWRANLMIGGLLLGLALLQLVSGAFSLLYPPFLLGGLLLATGIFHMELALPTWRLPSIPSHGGGCAASRAWGRALLLAMGACAVLTQDMLRVLVTGVAVELAGLACGARRSILKTPELAA